jgi:hypothetical protein
MRRGLAGLRTEVRMRIGPRATPWPRGRSDVGALRPAALAEARWIGFAAVIAGTVTLSSVPVANGMRDRGAGSVGNSIQVTRTVDEVKLADDRRLRVRHLESTVTGTITLGGPAESVTLASGDDAALSFSGASGQRVFVNFSNVTIGTSGCCSTAVSIRKPDGTTLTGTATYAGTAGGYIDTATLPITGTYTIVVDPLGTATGSATITAYDVPADPEPVLQPTQAGAATTLTSTVPGKNIRPTFSTSSGNAAQWERISEYGLNAHQTPIVQWGGAMTQWQACQQGVCNPGTDNTASQGWKQLWHALNSRADYDGHVPPSAVHSRLPFSTDIFWTHGS